MKTPEEIEKLALDKFPTVINKYTEVNEKAIMRFGFIKGYTKCQQDNTDNAIGFAEWIIKNDYLWITGASGWSINSYQHREDKPLSTKELYEIYIQSLNK